MSVHWTTGELPGHHRDPEPDDDTDTDADDGPYCGTRSST